MLTQYHLASQCSPFSCTYYSARPNYRPPLPHSPSLFPLCLPFPSLPSPPSYGLRYQYGMFRQVIQDGFQHEQPDYWLNFGNPWEIERVYVTYPVRVSEGGREGREWALGGR